VHHAATLMMAVQLEQMQSSGEISGPFKLVLHSGYTSERLPATRVAEHVALSRLACSEPEPWDVRTNFPTFSAAQYTTIVLNKLQMHIEARAQGATPVGGNHRSTAAGRRFFLRYRHQHRVLCPNDHILEVQLDCMTSFASHGREQKEKTETKSRTCWVCDGKRRPRTSTICFLHGHSKGCDECRLHPGCKDVRKPLEEC